MKSWRRDYFACSVAISLLTVVWIPKGMSHTISDAEREAWHRPATIPFPKDNPYTPEKAALGKMLFFDARLSRDKNLSCASCHNPSFGWQVPFAKAIGAGGKPLGRHAPTTLNQAWSKALFWDGRAPTLEVQATGPIEAPAEMALPLTIAVTRLTEVRGYAEAFRRAYPMEGITAASIAKAIATYERTIVSGNTSFDRWIQGDDDALSASAKRGFRVFTGKGQCAACHTGWNFTDDKYHDIGLSGADTGRGGVTHVDDDLHRFKTPGLRETAARAPYMHDGSLPTLEAVIGHYATGGIQRSSLSPMIKPVAFEREDVQDLLAFLRSLSSQQSSLVLPNLPAH